MGLSIISMKVNKPDLYPHVNFDEYKYQEYPKMVYPLDGDGKPIGGVHATVNGIDTHRMPAGVPDPIVVNSIEEEDAAIGRLAIVMEKIDPKALAKAILANQKA